MQQLRMCVSSCCHVVELRRPALTPSLHCFAPCSPDLDLEYKYVVRNHETGEVVCWKPGTNYQIKVPILYEVRALGRVLWGEGVWRVHNV